jgi:hypothetical protein
MRLHNSCSPRLYESQHANRIQCETHAMLQQAASYPEGYRLGALSCGHLGSVFAGAHRELSVALVQSHGFVYHSRAQDLARCCMQCLRGGRCRLGWTRPSSIVSADVVAAPVCWL